MRQQAPAAALTGGRNDWRAKKKMSCWPAYWENRAGVVEAIYVAEQSAAYVCERAAPSFFIIISFSAARGKPEASIL